jgi:glycosyltransferase involved in cell wall biosynthesis
MVMEFSLVLTCFNEMRSLPQWYEDLRAQTRQPDEIVIVDSESTDGTTEFLREWEARDSRVSIVVQKCSPARGHNIGNASAKYEHIVSTDMGIRIDPNWFEEIVRPFEEDATVEIVAGSYAVDKSTIKSPAARAEYYIEGDGIPNLKPGFIPGNRSMAYTKKVWQELGGLPEDLTQYADDSVFGRQMLQVDYKMAYATKAMVYWPRPHKLRDYWKEVYGYGIGDGEASIKTPIAFRLYKKSIIPKRFIPFITAFRHLTIHICRVRLLTALRKKDFIGLAYVPILILGRGWYFAKGYLLGDARGEKECKACRARLSSLKDERT